MELSIKAQTMKYTYIYCITLGCNVVHVSIGLTFKTALYGDR